MATESNTHEELWNNTTVGEVMQNDAGFTFVDFLPSVVEPRRWFKPSTYENFGTLVDRANDFLRNNRKWSIVTCESVEFKAKRNDKVDPLKMTYLEYKKGFTSYIRGLRLWLTKNEDQNEKLQQISYFNLVPQQLQKPGVFKTCKFETLDAMIERFNTTLKFNPLPGRIITIESQKMMVDNIYSFKKFDPDRTNWTENGDFIRSFIFIVRIFYEITPDSPEEIGMKDFIPDIISEGGLCSLPKFERFSNVINKASAWWTEQSDLRFCNAQTLDINVTKPKKVDTQRMNYFVSGSMRELFVRILRISYAKSSANSDSATRLTCRTFLPLQTTTGKYICDYENLITTRERISAWIKATGARVLSAETPIFRIKTGGERKEGAEASFTWYGTINEHYMFGVRLYLDREYPEPPLEMFPPQPEMIAEKTCRLS